MCVCFDSMNSVWSWGKSNTQYLETFGERGMCDQNVLYKILF